MERLVQLLATRLRPHQGWPIALLAIAAAAAPGVAAGEASLALPDGTLLWAGLLGAALGLRLARPIGRGWRALQLAACAALGPALLVAAGGAAPPLGLVARDLGALAAALGGAPGAPQVLTGRYLSLALPRLWRALLDAPGAGEAGAALIVAALAVAATWPAAILLGWAAGGLRPVHAWGLPLLLALALTTILGGGGGAALVIGLALLLTLAVLVGATARERAWDREGYAYSELLRPAALGWGGATVALATMAALAIPTELPNFAARLPQGELPSGIAAIEGQVRRGRPTPAADPGLSQLPAVALGISLERGPPGAVSLRITTAAPMPPGPYPRYWRARVLNLYTGSAWTTDARRSPFPALPVDQPPPGAVAQRVEELRAGRGLAVALPDVVAVDRPAVAERLSDGSLAALEVAGATYSVVSRPQELATAEGAPAGAPPPSHADTLGLPASVTRRVRDLAQTIAGDAGAPLDRALALEAYLRGLPYSYEVRPLPRGGDAVDQFLFEMRHGYCTYYASAMAVMARSLGIPARVAVGYATGEYDEAAGAYLVREADAHAWPELLIGGRWLPFEPTPIRPLPERSSAPPPTPAEAPADAPAPAARPLLAWGLAALAGGAIAAAGGWLAWRAARVPPLARAQLRLERIGRRAGVPWPAGATLHEYGRLLAARGGGGWPALDELVATLEAARYGRRPLGPAELRRLRRAEAELRARLRRPGPSGNERGP